MSTKRFAIRRSGRLGDLINVIPLVRAAQRAEYEIDFACDPQYHTLMQSVGCTTHFPGAIPVDVCFDGGKATQHSHRFYRDSNKHPLEIVQFTSMRLGFGSHLEWRLPVSPTPHPDDFILVMPNSVERDRTLAPRVVDELVDKLRPLGPVVLDRGERPLFEMFYLVSQATVLVSPDSGQVHVARAFDVPVVGFFNTTDSARRGPYLADHHCLDTIDIDAAVGLVSTIS